MQQYLVIIGLIAANVGFFTLLFYRPKDILPSSYDPLKWLAALVLIAGVLILSTLAAPLLFIVLGITYFIAYKQCAKDISDSLDRDEEPGGESIVCPAIALFIWLIAGRSTLSGIILVFALAGYFSCRFYFAYRHALASRDAKEKQLSIDMMLPYTVLLLRLLTRYHPSWYPPPINRYLESSIARYAALIREYDRANGSAPSNRADFEQLCSYGSYSQPFSSTSFPHAWNFQKIDDFCMTFMEIVARLALTAELTLEQNTQYAGELTKLFEAKTEEALERARDQLPPFMDEIFIRIIDWLSDGKEASKKLKDIEARLIAFIPDYIAATTTVIGTPPNGLPIAYDSLESRYRHTFLIGSSGAGKSTVITNLVTQDMHKGYGVIVISPDQRLFRDLVPYIPEYRLDDVIYFDPNDTTSPIIGFNPFYFETPAKLKPQEREYKTLRDNKVQETYAVLERTLQIKTEPTQRLLNNAMYALTGRPNTIFRDLSRLIDPTERAFHMEIVNDPRVDDETQKFWKNYASERANAMVYRTLSDQIMPLLRSSLSEVFSTQSFSFHRELNERARIFLIDLSTFGSRTSREAKIAAQLLIPTIHQTLFRRNTINESDYIPYFMYIDEFQHFANTNEETINDMAEQTRKFHVGLTLTSLVASDLSPRLLDTINGVMRTKICLNISAKDARLFASELLIKRGGRDSYDPEALQTLGIGEAYVKTPPDTAAVFVKLPKEPVGNPPKVSITFEQLKRRSKANFGVRRQPQESTAVDQDAEPEHMEESPDTSPSPKPPVQIKTPKKLTPRQTTQRKRNPFDEDAGEPKIEIS